MVRYYKISLNIFLFFTASFSFYIFSRFTVDDAFISWRYGKNLVSHEIWNYNPSYFEVVQAYTNPLFAFLSIAPNYIGMDIVLFFKIISVITMMAFFAWAIWQSIPIWIALLILSMPATQIHLYSGLETFTYCFLLAWTFICLQEQKEKTAIAMTILVCLTRPESWMLCAISPVALSINREKLNNINFSSGFENFYSCINIKKLLWCSTPIIISLAIYLIVEYRNFGDIIPNTFRIKSGHERPTDTSLALMLLFVLFSLMPLFKKEFVVLSAAVILYMLPVIYVYSRSDLQMNYASRFVFHVAMVIIIIIAKYSSTGDKSLTEKLNRRHFFKMNEKTITLIFLIIFIIYFSSKDALGLINYYPRSLESHSEIGKSIAKIKDSKKITSFTFGDAGMAAYQSDIFSIDNVGLANKAIGRGEFSENYLNIVAPQIIFLYGNQNGVYHDMSNQSTLIKWINEKKYRHQCSIYWRPDYLIYVYGKEEIKEINEVCEKSKQLNNIGELEFMRTHITRPPWVFWKE